MNYITSVGVQQFSITIASGSLTGTATITGVGSGAFICYGGINPTNSNTASLSLAYITKTNSTTITATRKASTSGTIVVTGCIVDGDTTNLIKSVQYGTISLTSAATSATATISAVTNVNAALQLLGYDDDAAAGIWVINTDPFAISLSGTTVTATRPASGTNIVIGFVVIEFQGTALNQSVQNISATSSASVTSWTTTITSVNTSNTISFFNGGTLPNSSQNLSRVFYYGTLTNSTTFAANTNTAVALAKTYNACVVEFAAGVLNSAVQRGTTTLTAVTSNTSTIAGITAANSGITFLGNTTSASTLVFDQAEGAVVLTNGTTVTTTKNTSTANITSSWEVFEFPAFSGGSVHTIGFTGFGCGGIVNTTGSGTVGYASCG